MSFPPVSEQMALLTRGAVEIHVRKELEERLERSRTTGVPLRVKLGLDPTRPDLHVGHAVPLAKLRQFQDLGHTAILLIGSFTAMVGDPSGQNDLRPRLTREQVLEAAKTYTDQAFKILDEKRLELRWNSEWLDKLSATDMVELMAKMTVARMLERNDFGQRFAEGRPIHQHEFLYPLLQGYDSVALDCDMELGGTDQLFNLMVGRDIMPRYGLTPQMVLTVPLLEGTDARIDENGHVVGKKMSKSAGNYIGLKEDPLTQYRKVMQIDDDVIFRYFELLSSLSTEAIADLKRAKQSGERKPQDIKALFARELVTRFHDAQAAETAEADFQRIYASDALPSDIPEQTVTTEGATLWIAKALSSTGLVKSTGEGKRLVEQGGVELDQQRVTDPQLQLERGKRYLLRVGSKNRRFVYVTVA
ncbi:tyrosine--tRNA ligase [Pendulispora albinea]|uniref:Tyrosine--tRNA ligase n=1 Tax=Pendulispora albinea TaxID=2741071 RepID=A0ABZ2LMX0_9BACT